MGVGTALTGLLLPGSGIGQNLGTDAGLGKKKIFGIAMKEVLDAGMRDQDPNSQTLITGRF